jgi:DNA polymerase-3 subunit epsilon
MFAIVDIETTGGIPEQAGITEIAIICHDGQAITSEYHSLINPEQKIPSFITGITGINNAMVAHAPVFSEVAADLFAILDGLAFVAHNVHFDYGFIRHHLQKNGYQWQPPLFCTVQMGRRFLPGHASYSLGKICASLGIPLEDRHRAMGDARATVQLFERILASGGQSFVKQQLSKKGFIPRNNQ